MSRLASALAFSLGQAADILPNVSPALESLINRALTRVIDPVSSERSIDRYYVDVIDGPARGFVVRHTYLHNSKPIEFRYRIVFGESLSRVTPHAQPGGEVTLTFPDSEWSDATVRRLQDQWRCVVIADPVLNRRFTAPKMEYEDYQIAAIRAALSDLEKTGKAFLLLGTGAGKTEIFWEMVDRILSKRRAEALSGEKPAKVIFVLNNTTVLEEAQVKADRKFKDGSAGRPKYSTGRLYGGFCELDRDIIFATPQSLTSEQRLTELLAEGNVCLVGFDEVHHIVAWSLKTIFRELERHEEATGTTIGKLGLTATETRTDLQEPLALFNHHISAEALAGELIRRGFLVPFEYFDCSGWTGHTEPERVPATDEEAEIRAAIGSDGLYVHTWNTWRDKVAAMDDRRSLVVVENKLRAREMAAYFRQQIDPRTGKLLGDTVCVLTGEDKVRDAVYADDLYEAWKTGKWAPNADPNSPEPEYKKGPVPEILIGVNLFLEGTDAPGIRHLFFARDINALTVFVQLFGRGLRQDILKSVLKVYDMVGLCKKLHLLQFLMSFGQGIGRDESRSKRSLDEEKGEPGDDADSDEDVHESRRVELSDWLKQTFAAADESSAVWSHFEDVPAALVRRHANLEYSSLSDRERGQLDACIANRLGFATGDEYEGYLSKLASTLMAGVSASARSDLRTPLVRAFLRPHTAATFDLAVDTVRLNRATRLVYYHLLERMRSTEPELDDAHLAAVVPELSRGALAQVANIAANLKQVREIVFGKSPGDTIEELVDEVLKPGHISSDRVEHDLLHTLSLEDPSDKEHALVEIENPTLDEYAILPGLEGRAGKDAAALWFTRHPRLQAKIRIADFLLEPADFYRRLVQSDLVAVPVETFWDKFGKTMLAAGKIAAKAPIPMSGTQAVDAFVHFVQTPGAPMAIRLAIWSEAQVKVIESVRDRVDQEPGSSAHVRRCRQVSKLLDDVVRDIRGVHHSSVHKGMYNVSRERKLASPADRREADAWIVRVERGTRMLAKVQVDVRHEIGRHILVITHEVADDLCTAVRGVNSDHFHSLTEAIGEVFLDIANLYANPVVVLPSGWSVTDPLSASFRVAVSDHLSENSTHEIIVTSGQVRRAYSNFTPTLADLDSCRFPNLTLSEVRHWQRSGSSKGFSGQIGGVLEALHFVQEGGQQVLRNIVNIGAPGGAVRSEFEHLNLLKLLQDVLGDKPLLLSVHLKPMNMVAELVRSFGPNYANDPRLVSLLVFFHQAESFDLEHTNFRGTVVHTVALRASNLLTSLQKFLRAHRLPDTADFQALVKIAADANCVFAAIESGAAAETLLNQDSVKEIDRLVDVFQAGHTPVSATTPNEAAGVPPYFDSVSEELVVWIGAKPLARRKLVPEFHIDPQCEVFLSQERAAVGQKLTFKTGATTPSEWELVANSELFIFSACRKCNSPDSRASVPRITAASSRIKRHDHSS